MSLSAVWVFVGQNWQFLLSVLGIVLGWLKLTAKVAETIGDLRDHYVRAKQWAKNKDLYKSASTAYGVISKLSRKTETTLDDKAARGLEVALNVMRKMGWSDEDIGNGEKDVILKVFDELHENEHLALEAAKGGPVSNRLAKPGEIAAPLAG